MVRITTGRPNRVDGRIVTLGHARGGNGDILPTAGAFARPIVDRYALLYTTFTPFYLPMKKKLSNLPEQPPVPVNLEKLADRLGFLLARHWLRSREPKKTTELQINLPRTRLQQREK